MDFGFGQKKTRKEEEIRMVSGQKISLTLQDVKLLRHAYDYMQGFFKRSHLEDFVMKKREKVAEKKELLKDVLSAKDHQSNAGGKMSVNATSSLKGYRSDDRTSDEKEVDAYYKLVDEIESLEEKLRALMRTDHKISLKDIDAIMQALGIVPQKRALEHMIYEVDEMVDDVICWDEFQLNYYRNINDVTGSEPSSFFRLIEFIVFDHNHKGHIMEDDVMEILFARIGANKLEKELKTIFGNNLRAAGGDGTLSLEHYLSACLLKSGRRALVC